MKFSKRNAVPYHNSTDNRGRSKLPKGSEIGSLPWEDGTQSWFHDTKHKIITQQNLSYKANSKPETALKHK